MENPSNGKFKYWKMPVMENASNEKCK